MYCKTLFESDHLNILLIFIVIQLITVIFILAANIVTCSSKWEMVNVFLLIGANLDLPQIYEHLLDSLSLDRN